MTNRQIKPGIFIEPPGAKYRGVLKNTDLRDIWEKTKSCYGYLKPDGWRIQAHITDENFVLYSREGIDYVDTFPTVAQNFLTTFGGKRMTMDIEIIGYNYSGKHIPPSQIRKATKHVAIVLDVLFIDNRDVTNLPTQDRRELIEEFIKPQSSSNLIISEYRIIEELADLDVIFQDFLQRQDEGYDGVILKKMDSLYFTDVLKIKTEITLDPVVLGIYFNNEKEIKSFLVAVKDQQTNLWIPIGKVAGQGEDWDGVCSACKGVKEINSLSNNIFPPPDQPDTWISPEIIVQITARSISKGAQNSYILRADAPRDLLLREDKHIKTATTFDQMCEIAGIDRPPIPFGLFGI